MSSAGDAYFRITIGIFLYLELLNQNKGNLYSQSTEKHSSKQAGL